MGGIEAADPPGRREVPPHTHQPLRLSPVLMVLSLGGAANWYSQGHTDLGGTVPIPGCTCPQLCHLVLQVDTEARHSDRQLKPAFQHWQTFQNHLKCSGGLKAGNVCGCLAGLPEPRGAGPLTPMEPCRGLGWGLLSAHTQLSSQLTGRTWGVLPGGTIVPSHPQMTKQPRRVE